MPYQPQELLLVDLVLALILAEVALLFFWLNRRGLLWKSRALFATLGSGAALVAALRFGLGGAAFYVIAGCLVLSLLFHLADLALRLRR